MTTEIKKLPSALCIHRALLENSRIKAELRLIRASHNPYDDMLMMSCVVCSSPLQLADTGLRYCKACDEIEQLKKVIKRYAFQGNLMRHHSRHKCEFTIKYAAGCPACEKALAGVRGEDLMAVHKAAALLRRDYIKELKALRDENQNVSITAARALRAAKAIRVILENKIKFYKDVLYSITKLPDSIDNCSIAKHRSKNAIEATYEVIHPYHKPLDSALKPEQPKEQDPPQPHSENQAAHS